MQKVSEQSTAYLDEAGRPQLRESIVAFFDILGFSHIATSCPTMEDSQRVLERIVAAIDDSRDFVRQSLKDGEAALASRWATKFFSDNLAFGFAYGNNPGDNASAAWFIVRCAQRYQLRMTMNGYFLRGALTQGPICLTNDIIFGSALIECYLLESKASIVPRVVLGTPLQEVLTNSYRANSDGLSNDLSQAICRDVDGFWFINYLQAAQNADGIEWDFIEQHKARILESLSHTTRHGCAAKVWLGVSIPQYLLPLAPRRSRLFGPVSNQPRRRTIDNRSAQRLG